jgi:hypothetical protein
MLLNKTQETVLILSGIEPDYKSVCIYGFDEVESNAGRRGDQHLVHQQDGTYHAYDKSAEVNFILFES